MYNKIYNNIYICTHIRNFGDILLDNAREDDEKPKFWLRTSGFLTQSFWGFLLVHGLDKVAGMMVLRTWSIQKQAD